MNKWLVYSGYLYKIYKYCKTLLCIWNSPWVARKYLQNFLYSLKPFLRCPQGSYTGKV